MYINTINNYWYLLGKNIWINKNQIHVVIFKMNLAKKN
jgi:hypothetical protein